MQHWSRFAGLATLVSLCGIAGGANAAPRPPCNVAGACIELGGPITSMQLRDGGRYHVTSTLEIAGGATLTIPAGTALYFDPGTALESIEPGARLVIAGTPERLALLTSAVVDPAAGDWNGLFIFDTMGNVVRNAQIEFATTGIRAIDSGIEIADSRILQSGRDAISLEGDFAARVTGNTLINEALRVEAGINVTHISDVPVSLEVRDNTIQGFGSGISTFAVTSASIVVAENHLRANGAGIAVRSVGFGLMTGAPQILDNTIEGNDEGVFIYGGAPRIERNSIVGNTCLAIYINAFADDLGFAPVITANEILRNRGGCVGVRDLTIVHPTAVGSVDARRNHWGATDIDAVGELVRDGVDVPGRAVARLCPLADASGAEVRCTDPRPR